MFQVGSVDFNNNFHNTISTTTALAEAVPTPKADVAPPHEQKCQVFAELPRLSLIESSPANFAIASAKLTAPLQYNAINSS
ncbi:unnamed protein product [Caenorhabditis angaria]|nr:unnamed protein product [Caenorhabditis angaria]